MLRLIHEPVDEDGNDDEDVTEHAGDIPVHNNDGGGDEDDIAMQLIGNLSPHWLEEIVQDKGVRDILANYQE